MQEKRKKHEETVESTNITTYVSKIVWFQQFPELDKISHGADVVGHERSRWQDPHARMPARRTSCAAVVDSGPSMRWKMSVARNVICWRRLTGLFPPDKPGCDMHNRCDHLVPAAGRNAPLIRFLISTLYIFFACLYRMLPHLFFFSLFSLAYLLPYLSFPLRIDPLRFQAGCRKMRLQLALVF